MTATSRFVSRDYKIIVLLLFPLFEFTTSSKTSCDTVKCSNSVLIDLINNRRTKNGAVESFHVKSMICFCKIQECFPLCCFNNGCDSIIVNSESQTINEVQEIKNTWQFNSNSCPDGNNYYLKEFNKEDDGLFLLDKGTLYSGKKSFNKNYSDYCIDMSFKSSNTITVCFDKWNKSLFMETIEKILIFNLIISEIALLITSIVYLLLPQLLTLHGKILFCHSASLVLYYFSLLLRCLKDHEDINNFMFIDHLCSILAYLSYFSFVACFFWLNVMCIDVWNTFRNFYSVHNRAKSYEHKKFIMYSIYAWGCTIIFTSICLIVDMVPGIPKNFVRPNFGSITCWFHDRTAKIIYFNAPIGTIMLCNFCLFVITALKICQYRKSVADQLKDSDSERHNVNKKRFNLYLKLSIVMGITWTIEIISWFNDDWPKYLYDLTDFINTFQGIIIFLNFVWTDKTKRLFLQCLSRKALNKHHFDSS